VTSEPGGTPFRVSGVQWCPLGRNRAVPLLGLGRPPGHVGSRTRLSSGISSLAFAVPLSVFRQLFIIRDPQGLSTTSSALMDSTFPSETAIWRWIST
jgi:hypothetical protein